MTAPLRLVMTTAGLGRFTAAQVQDDIDLTVATVGLTDAQFVVAPTLTALPGQFRRVATISGKAASDNIVHMIVRDDAAISYQVRGFGLFLADGTLFAVYGQPDPIGQKSELASLMLAIDIAFPTADVTNLVFGDTNFLNPPATETTKGVVELATDEETATGTDAARAVTPKGLKARLAPILAATAGFVTTARRIDTSGLARSWAEGAEPGGAGTKSAKAYAADAATTVATIPIVPYTPAGYVFAILDALSNVGVGLREDGALVLRKLITDAVEAKAFNLLSGGLVEGAPFGFAFALQGADGGAAVGVKDDGTFVARDILASRLNGVDVSAILAGGGGGGTAAAITARRYDGEINYDPSLGQSLSMGGQSKPVISSVQRFDSLMFSGGTRSTIDTADAYQSLVPLLEAESPSVPTLGETPLTGKFDMINELIFSEDRLTKADIAYQMLGSCPGQDGGSLEQQSIGSVAFQHLTADVSNGYRLAQKAGKSFRFRSYSYSQGEGGGGSVGSTTAQFKAGLIKLRSDIEQMRNGITGENEPLLAFHYQTRIRMDIAQAHYEAARDNPYIYLYAPIYMLPRVPDDVHLTAFGSKILGAYQGIAYKRVNIDGLSNWSPLVPIFCDAQGRVATVRFNVPVGNLTVDTSLVSAKGAYGFTIVAADGTTIPILSVKIISRDTIKFLTTDPLPVGAKIRYGWDTTSPGGNIRDQQGDKIVFNGGGLNYPMHNYLVQFEETLN